MSEPKNTPKINETVDLIYPEHRELSLWLDKHNARFCYAVKAGKDVVKTTPRIEAWQIKATIVLIVLYPKNAHGVAGWDLYTSCGRNDIAATFTDAEERVK